MRHAVITIALFALLLAGAATVLAQKPATMPKELAGTIEQPVGKIAFIRDNNLWVTNLDGSGQFKVVDAQNADGPLSWAPDGKRVAFCRSGYVELKGPDHLGGKHKIYDVFIGFLDSAKTNTNWWFRLTRELGGRYPHWMADGSAILVTKDVNANTVNAPMPNYQTCLIDPQAESIRLIRKDWQLENGYMAIMPTPGPNNLHAYVLLNKTDRVGMAISSLDLTTLNETDIKAGKVKLLPGATAPAWSPDGKWIAYVTTSMDDHAIYITNSDLSVKFRVYQPMMGQMLQTYPLSWSPDSKWLTFAMNDGSIWIIDITGDGLRRILGPGLQKSPTWSKK